MLAYRLYSRPGSRISCLGSEARKCKLKPRLVHSATGILLSTFSVASAYPQGSAFVLSFEVPEAQTRFAAASRVFPETRNGIPCKNISICKFSAPVERNAGYTVSAETAFLEEPPSGPVLLSGSYEPFPQGAPGNVPSSKRHHTHHLRNLLIILGVGVALPVILVVAADR